MTMKIFGLALLSAALLMACDAPSATQSQTNQSQRGERRAAFRAACGADLQTYCPNAQSRQDRRACIAEHKEKFSEGCKTYMAQNPWRGRRNRDDRQEDQEQPPTMNP